jgi:hypothetical protein
MSRDFDNINDVIIDNVDRLISKTKKKKFNAQVDIVRSCFYMMCH